MSAVRDLYNVKQITNYDFPALDLNNIDPTNPPKSYQIPVPQMVFENGLWVFKKINMTVYYRTVLSGFNNGIPKLSYCCEPKGVAYPIFLNFGTTDEWHPFYLSERGMYEINFERIVEKYEDDFGNRLEEEIKADPHITGVRVPYDINFTLDYMLYGVEGS